MHFAFETRAQRENSFARALFIASTNAYVPPQQA